MPTDRVFRYAYRDIQRATLKYLDLFCWRYLQMVQRRSSHVGCGVPQSQGAAYSSFEGRDVAQLQGASLLSCRMRRCSILRFRQTAAAGCDVCRPEIGCEVTKLQYTLRSSVARWGDAMWYRRLCCCSFVSDAWRPRFRISALYRSEDFLLSRQL